MITADYPALLQLLQWTAASKTEVATVVYMLNKALEGYIQVIRLKIDSLEPYERPDTGHNSDAPVSINPVITSVDQSASTAEAGDVVSAAEDTIAVATIVVPTVPEHPSMPLLLDMFNIHKSCSKRMSESHRQMYEELFIKLFQRSELCLAETSAATSTGVSSSSSQGAPAALSEADEHPLLTTSWRVENSHMDITCASTPSITAVLKACTSRWSSQAGRGKVQGDKVDGRRKKKRRTDSDTMAEVGDQATTPMETLGETSAINTSEHAAPTTTDGLIIPINHEHWQQHEEKETKEEFV